MPPKYNYIAKPIIDRILEKTIIDENGCWKWAGSLGSNGYGQIMFQGKLWNLHKLVAYVYKLPNYWLKPVVCHKDVCKSNRNCHNPEHLFCGTQSENMSSNVKLNKRTHCLSGHDLSIYGKCKNSACFECYRLKHPQTKLSPLKEDSCG